MLIQLGKRIWKKFTGLVKANLVAILFFLGLACVLAGAIFGIQIENLPYIPKGTGEALLKGGSAILGAGIFAGIMKSALFTELFQKHISDVFYDPKEIKDKDIVIKKWNALTNALLKNVLPGAHDEATELIQKQFFKSEIDYHFENYKIRYVINIDKATNIATITHQVETTIVLSPDAINPCLKYSLCSLSIPELVRLRFNGKDYEGAKLEKADSLGPNHYELKLPEDLKTIADKFNDGNGNDQAVKLDRVITRTLDLKKDPYIAVKISRYIKEATVQAKITGGYKLHFQRFGLGNLPSDHHIQNDGMGFEEWRIAPPDCLLLPGQGFVIIPASL